MKTFKLVLVLVTLALVGLLTVFIVRLTIRFATGATDAVMQAADVEDAVWSPEIGATDAAFPETPIDPVAIYEALEASEPEATETPVPEPTGAYARLPVLETPEELAAAETSPQPAP